MIAALALGAKAALSGLLLWLVLRRLDPGAVAAAFAAADPAWLLAAGALSAAQAGVIAARWRIVLRSLGIRIGWRDSGGQVGAALLVNQALPSTVGGDAVRIWQLARLGFGTGAGVAGVVLDRIVALLAMLVVVALVLPWLGPRLVATGDPLGRPVLAATISACGLGIPAALLLLRLRLEGLARRLRPGTLSRFLQRLARPEPWLAALAACLGIAGHLGTPAIAFAMGRAVGLPLSPGFCLLVVPLVATLTILPISLAGWGVREVGMVAIGPLLGASPEACLLLALGLGLSQLWQGLFGGAVWAASRLVRPPALPAAGMPRHGC